MDIHLKDKIEQLLGGHLYPVAMVAISLLIWSYRYTLPAENVLAFSFYSLFLLSIPFFLVSIFYKNTVYTLPIFFGAVFSLGAQDMGLHTFDMALVGFLNVFLIIAAMIAHVIIYKTKFKLKSLGLSLILVSISFILPEFSKPFLPVGTMLASLGVFYLIIYLYYANTIEGNQLQYLMRTFMLLGLFLTTQLVLMWYDGFLVYEGNDIILDFIRMFNLGTGSQTGWGNMNDLTIHLVLFSASVIYYLYRYPTKIFPWLYLAFIAFWIYVSNARGSMITVSILGLGTIIYAIFKRNKRQLLNLIITVFIGSIVVYIFYPTIEQIWTSFIETINFDDPDSMLTGRITLWFNHENSAWVSFLKNPVVGTGWYNQLWILGEQQNRITIYHSTIFQVLATTGLFGFFVLIYQFVCIGRLFVKNIRFKAVSAFMLTYLLSQIHGLVDNTQYMVHFSIITYIVFAVFDNLGDEPDYLPSELLNIKKV
jgi:O-antigen ligase